MRQRPETAQRAAFGFVHIVFGSWFSVIASDFGSWIFASRYVRTRSLFTGSVEHSVYGILVFTVGLGRYFSHGPVPETPVRAIAPAPA
ncbi:hypothetical protein [Nocardia sp. CY41]|uniref:hypothetical protein n=1 Tax=Nocardia sp. CY41 TaxID=2608686 RepID=UPI001916B14F|nr:hypothetical protein [Nocardia sp. CY41]